jgi:hypothetical protein
MTIVMFRAEVTRNFLCRVDELRAIDQLTYLYTIKIKNLQKMFDELLVIVTGYCAWKLVMKVHTQFFGSQIENPVVVTNGSMEGSAEGSAESPDVDEKKVDLDAVRKRRKQNAKKDGVDWTGRELQKEFMNDVASEFPQINKNKGEFENACMMALKLIEKRNGVDVTTDDIK